MNSFHCFFWYLTLVATFSLGASAASANSIQVLDIGDSGVANDGTLFEGVDPSDPSTGTGVFLPFVRIQTGPTGPQSGYDTDGTIEFDTKPGPWTHSIMLSDVNIVQRNGTSYYEFTLDADQKGGATSTPNQLSLTEVALAHGGSNLQLELLGPDRLRCH